MEIKIVRKIDENYISEALLVWKLNTGKLRKDAVLILIMCVAFFIVGMFRINQHHSFWNPWTALGIAAAFNAIIYFFDLSYKKSKAVSNANKCIEAVSSSENYIEYVFCEKFISIKDMESYAEFNWSIFSTYQLYQNYLLIYAKNSGYCIILIDKNRITEDTSEAMLNLIYSKLPAKK